MIGHAFGNDVTNRVYGHRDLRDLKIEIEKIDKECFVTLLWPIDPKNTSFF